MPRKTQDTVLCQTVPAHEGHLNAVSNLEKLWWPTKKSECGAAGSCSCGNLSSSLGADLKCFQSWADTGCNLEMSGRKVQSSFRQIPTRKKTTKPTKQKPRRTFGLNLMFILHTGSLAAIIVLQAVEILLLHIVFPASLTGDNDSTVVLALLAV